MLERRIIDDIAQRLDVAEKTRERIRPPSAQYAAMTIDDAYAVQRAWVALKVASGRKISRAQNRADLEGDAEHLQR